MLWLVQLFIGMFFGFYAISPRLRGFINGSIVKLVRRGHHTEVARPKIIARYVLEDEEVREHSGLTDGLATEPVTLGSRKGIEVGEDMLEKWMAENPDLVKSNGIKT